MSYLRKNKNGDTEIFLETQEERQEMENVRQSIRNHVTASNCAYQRMKKVFDNEYFNLLKRNRGIVEGQAQHDALPWYKRWWRVRPYGLKYNQEYLVGWRWLYIDTYPDMGILPGVMSQAEYEAIQKFVATDSVDHMIHIDHIEKDEQGGGYHEGYFFKYYSLPAIEWHVGDRPVALQGYKYAIYDRNLPDRGTANGTNEPDPKDDY